MTLVVRLSSEWVETRGEGSVAPPPPDGGQGQARDNTLRDASGKGKATSAATTPATKPACKGEATPAMLSKAKLDKEQKKMVKEIGAGLALRHPGISLL